MPLADSDAPDGVEGAGLVLKPLGIPATAFMTQGIEAEYRRLLGLGIQFRGEPKAMAPSSPPPSKTPAGCR